jgi:hypothetical protein
MPDKTGAMILSTLMMLAVASALSASTPQRNLSSCCSCHGTTQGVRRRTNASGMQASAWGRAGPRLQWANLYTRYYPNL